MAEKLDLDRRLSRVLHAEAHHGGRQRGIGNIERNERRERLESDLHRAVGVAIADPSDRVTAVEGDLAETLAIERPRFAADGEGEALLQRAERPGGRDIIGPLAGLDLAALPVDAPRSDPFLIAIEYIPEPEPAVAAEVERAGKQPACRHADVLKRLGIGPGLLFAASVERGEPLGAELLVRGNDPQVFVVDLAGVDRGKQGMRGDRAHGAARGDHELAARRAFGTRPGGAAAIGGNWRVVVGHGFGGSMGCAAWAVRRLAVESVGRVSWPVE